MPIIIEVAAVIEALRAYLPQSRLALPILLFLVAKLVAYTLLGALLGWLGSYLTLSPTSAPC